MNLLHLLIRNVRSALDIRKLALILPFSLGCSFLVQWGISLLMRSDNFFIMSLAFFPIMGGIALIMGIGFFIIQMHANKLNGISFNYFKTLLLAFFNFLKIAYILWPVLLIFMAKKIVAIAFFGSLFLLQDTLFFASIRNIILNFMPTLLVIWMITFSLGVVLTLFVVTPSLVLKEGKPFHLVKNGYKSLKIRPFFSLILFVLAAIPSLVILRSSLSLNTFYLALLMSPMLALFFNFATEHFLHVDSQRPLHVE
jgi:hypothetical protein